MDLKTPAQTLPESGVLPRNRQLVERYFHEAWNQGEAQLLNEILAPDYVDHAAGASGAGAGPGGAIRRLRATRRSIRNLQYEILDMVLEETRVAVFLRMTGIHTGDFFGTAVDQPIDIRRMQIAWIRHGRIWQHWEVGEELSILEPFGPMS